MERLCELCGGRIDEGQIHVCATCREKVREHRMIDLLRQGVLQEVSFVKQAPPGYQWVAWPMVPRGVSRVQMMPVGADDPVKAAFAMNEQVEKVLAGDV